MNTRAKSNRKLSIKREQARLQREKIERLLKEKLELILRYNVEKR